MKNRRSTAGGRRSIDKISTSLDNLRIQTVTLAERVNHLASANAGMREITDHVIKQMTQNSLDIIKSGADLESRINKWMVAIVFFIASATGGIVMLVLQFGVQAK